MCGVITYPYHNKISMQLQEFTAACIKWVLEWVFEIWHSQPYSSTKASWCVMSLKEYSKELVQSSFLLSLCEGGGE